MAGPDLLQTSIDATYSYSYVVLPFLQADLLGELDEETAEEMEETFGSFFPEKAGGRTDRRFGGKPQAVFELCEGAGGSGEEGEKRR